MLPFLVYQKSPYWSAMTTAGTDKRSNSNGRRLMAQAVLKRPAIVFGQVILARDSFVFILDSETFSPLQSGSRGELIFGLSHLQG